MKKHRIRSHPWNNGGTWSLHYLRISETVTLMLDGQEFSLVGNGILSILKVKHFEYLLKFVQLQSLRWFLLLRTLDMVCKDWCIHIIFIFHILMIIFIWYALHLHMVFNSCHQLLLIVLFLEKSLALSHYWLVLSYDSWFLIQAQMNSWNAIVVLNGS